MGKIAVSTLKILESGTIEEKAKFVKNRASYMQYLSIKDQLYFLNQDPERYFMHCDEDVISFLLDAFPDYFVAFASDALKREWCEYGKLDPGYVEGTLAPMQLGEEELSAMIMAYAKNAKIDDDIKEEFPEEFENVEARNF